MTSTEETTGIEEQVMEEQAIEEQEEAYDTGEALPSWVIAPKAQRDPLLPVSPLTDTQLYLVVQTRLTAKERRDRYPEEFDVRGIPLRGRPGLLATDYITRIPGHLKRSTKNCSNVYFQR